MVETCRGAQRRGTLTICKQVAHHKWLTPCKRTQLVMHTYTQTDYKQQKQRLVPESEIY